MDLSDAGKWLLDHHEADGLSVPEGAIVVTDLDGTKTEIPVRFTFWWQDAGTH